MLKVLNPTSLSLPGYVQGMSDLLSPILEVMENEVDAFWCFVGYMDLVVRFYAIQCPSTYAEVAGRHVPVPFLSARAVMF